MLTFDSHGILIQDSDDEKPQTDITFTGHSVLQMDLTLLVPRAAQRESKNNLS